MSGTAAAVAAFVVLAAVAAAIGAEFLGWLPVVTGLLVRIAVLQLPADKRQRYREEFLHDIETKARGRKLSALVWAVGICLVAHKLARAISSESETRVQEPPALPPVAPPVAPPVEYGGLWGMVEEPDHGQRRQPDQPLAASLKRLREERGLTQEDLAFYAELTPNTLSRVERGIANPSWTTVRKIAVALNVSIVELGEEIERPRP